MPSSGLVDRQLGRQFPKRAATVWESLALCVLCGLDLENKAVTGFKVSDG